MENEVYNGMDVVCINTDDKAGWLAGLPLLSLNVVIKNKFSFPFYSYHYYNCCCCLVLYIL